MRVKRMYKHAVICERGLRGPSLRGASRPRHDRCPCWLVIDAHCNILYDGCNGLLPRSFGDQYLRGIGELAIPALL
jgi:hypothetical protein